MVKEMFLQLKNLNVGKSLAVHYIVNIVNVGGQVYNFKQFTSLFKVSAANRDSLSANSAYPNPLRRPLLS